MRVAKLLLVVGLVLAVSGTAGAATAGLTYANPLPAADTPIRFNIINWDMAKTYDLTGQTLPVEGVATVNALPQNAIPGGKVITLPQVGPGGIGAALVGQTEDVWGVVKVLSLVADPGATEYWSDLTDPNKEIVGVFYGGVDTYVSTNALGQQVVSAAGLFFDIYAQDKGIFDETLGSSGRLAFNQYEGVGYTALNTLDPSAVLLAHMESTDNNNTPPADATAASDIDGDGDPDGDFQAVFVPAAAPVGSGTGKSFLFWDIVGGIWDVAVGTAADPGFEAPANYFPNTDPRFGSSVDADLHSDQNINPYFNPTPGPDENWIVSSDDPTRGRAAVAVPEPITVFGALMGIGGVAGYIRRRRS